MSTADHAPEVAPGPWTPFELGVVRGAGFSLQRLDALVDEEYWRLAALVGALTREQACLSRQLLDAAERVPLPTEREARRRARDVVGRVRRGQPLEADLGRWTAELAGLPGWDEQWARTVGALGGERARLAEHWTATLGRVRRGLAALCADPRVQEAVVLLAPDVVDRSMRRVRDGVEADGFVHDERKLAAFAQRLCAKAESNAFIGPVAYTCLLPGGNSAYALPVATRRRGLVAWWAARELVLTAVTAAEPWRWPVPRRGPAASTVTLPAPLGRLVAQVDGRTPWPDLVDAPAPGLVRKLDEAGVVLTAPDLPTSEPVVLDALEDARRTHRLPVLDTAVPALQALAGEFAHAGAHGKIRCLARAEALLRDHGVTLVRRGQGQLYADRTVLYEEDHDAGRALTLAPAARHRLLEALQPTLDFCAEAAAWAHGRARAEARDALRTVAAGRSSVPFLEAVGVMPLALPVALGAAPCVRRLERLVAERWDGRAAGVRIAPQELHAGAGALPRDELLLASPDVLLAAGSRADVEAGRFQVVLGEVHWGFQVLSNLAAFVEEREGLLGAGRAWLGSPAGVPQALNVALSQRYGKLCFLEAAPRTVELTGVAARGSDRVDPASLTVDVATGDVRDASGVVVRLLLGDGDGGTQPVFGPPSLSLPAVRLGRRSPRIELGDTVLQRATWWFDDGEVPRGRGREAYTGLVAWWDEQGLPRRVFVRLPGEPKPVYVDAASPLLSELLLARGDGGGELRVSEALPGGDGLWLRGPDGPCVAELRLTFIRQTNQKGG